MNYISTTGLRTKSSELIESLLAGKSVDLFHRSKLVGKVVPVEKKEKIKSNFVDLIKSFSRKKPMTVKQMDRAYRKEMVKKHGKHISGC